MTYRVAFSKAAQRDLRKLSAHLARRFGVVGALAYEDQLFNICNGLSTAPIRGSKQPQLGSGYRNIGYDRRTTITFKVDESRREVTIVRVRHRGRLQ